MPFSSALRGLLPSAAAGVRGAWVPLVVALLFTLLNAVKPLHIDDSAYFAYATRAGEHPLDPYGFVMLWLSGPAPAGHVLAPPLVPLWWGAGIRLFGPQPLLWKLWFFPFSLVLVLSLWHLLRRWAGGLEVPLLAMTVLSPALLPSFNLMTDVPALGLSLAAVALFARACDRPSAGLAALAGLAAGLAIQAKYTGALAPAAMLLYALAFRAPRLWCVAAACAALVFGAWEGWLVWSHGESHFLYHLGHMARDPMDVLFLPLFVTLGCVAPAVGLLGTVALRAPRWVTAGSLLLTALGYALIAFPPSAAEWPAGRLGVGRPATLPLGGILFAVLGAAALVGVMLAATASLGRGRRPAPPPGPAWDRAGLFLALWLGLEIVGYFAVSPFPAVRRVLGLTVVMTLIVGRLAASRGVTPALSRRVWGVAAAGTALGLAFFALDDREALAQKEAAEAAAAATRARDPGATAWFTGLHGFQYYAERQGMRPVVARYAPGREPIDWPGPSQFRTGDYLAVPTFPVLGQEIALPPDCLEEVDRIVVRDAIPLRLAPYYYGGNMPLRSLRGPRLIVTIFRVRAPFVAEPGPR